MHLDIARNVLIAASAYWQSPLSAVLYLRT
jgi:hypothetical protein